MRAVGANRIAEARLTGGFSHAPLHQKTNIAFDREALERIDREVGKELAQHSTPERLADAGIIRLIAGRVESAIDLFQKATAAAPNDARLLSNLAACYLAQGDIGTPLSYIKALTLAQRAHRADRALLEASFNWALALERNFLVARAEAAWIDYLRLDSHSAWAKDAEDHLAALSRPSRVEEWNRLRPELDRAVLQDDGAAVRRIVESFPYRARKYAEEELFPGWAEAFAAGRRDEATRLLDIARWNGQALALSQRDHLIANLVSAIDLAVQKGTVDDVVSIQRAFTKGRSLCRASRGIEGTALLRGVHELVEHFGSPFIEVGALRLATCSYEQADYRNAISLLETALARPRVERYPSLLGQVQWLRGMSYLSLAEPLPALRAHEAAAALFQEAGYAEEVGSMSYLLATDLRYLGDTSSGWIWLFRGVAESVRNGEVRALYAAFDELAEAADGQHQPEAALLFRSEVVRLAFLEPDAPGITHALLRLGQAHCSLGHRDKGLQALAAAERQCAQIEDADARSRRQADVLLAEGKATEDPRSALLLLSRALDFYRGKEERFSIVDAYLARAQAFRASGNDEAGKGDLLAGVEEFERQRGELPQGQLRLSYFEQARNLFDLLIDATARRPGGDEAALGYAERERARVLLDRLREGGSPASSASRSQPLGATALKQQIPDGAALIEYAMLPDRLLLWVLRRGQIHMVSSDVPPREVQALVERFRSDLEKNRSEAVLAQTSTQLHSALIGPALPWLNPGDTLIFIPDKSLNGVPFAALWNPRSRRYLVEDHAVGVAPSATLFLESTERARSFGRSSLLDALVVGQPLIDSRRFQSLGTLARGTEEVAKIAAIYGNEVEVLTGEGATPRAVLAHAGEHAVVHLGSHAIPNDSAPALSGLPLTSMGSDDSGMLYARDIEQFHFKRTQLVVLSACDTAGGVTQETEGVLSLSRSFIAAGVPSVIASLWSLDDRLATDISLAIHHQLRSGLDSLSALRKAQLSILRGSGGESRSPARWSGFEHFGGVREEPSSRFR